MSDQAVSSIDLFRSEEHIEVFHRLTDEFRVLRDVLDELREHVSYTLRNSTPSGYSVIKRMGLDPTSDDWGEHLVIVRSPSQSASDLDGSLELQQARDTIRDLLGVCELNLDELDESTRAIIQRAQNVVSAQLPEALVDSVPELPPMKPPSVPMSPGRLF